MSPITRRTKPVDPARPLLDRRIAYLEDQIRSFERRPDCADKDFALPHLRTALTERLRERDLRERLHAWGES